MCVSVDHLRGAFRWIATALYCGGCLGAYRQTLAASETYSNVEQEASDSKCRGSECLDHEEHPYPRPKVEFCIAHCWNVEGTWMLAHGTWQEALIKP